jgi:hypothetical protein
VPLPYLKQDNLRKKKRGEKKDKWKKILPCTHPKMIEKHLPIAQNATFTTGFIVL